MKNNTNGKIKQHKIEITRFNKGVYIIGTISAVLLIVANVLFVKNSDTRVILLSLSGSLMASLLVSFLLELSSNLNKEKVINQYRSNDLMPLTLNVKTLLNNYISLLFEVFSQFELYKNEPVTFKFGDDFKELDKSFNYLERVFNEKIENGNLSSDCYLKVKKFREFVFSKFVAVTKSLDIIILNEQNRNLNFSLSEVEQLKIIKSSYQDYIGLEEFDNMFFMLKEFYFELIKLSIFGVFDGAYIIKKGIRQNFYNKSGELIIPKSKIDEKETKSVYEVVKANYTALKQTK